MKQYQYWGDGLAGLAVERQTGKPYRGRSIQIQLALFNFCQVFSLPPPNHHGHCPGKAQRPVKLFRPKSSRKAAPEVVRTSDGRPSGISGIGSQEHDRDSVSRDDASKEKRQGRIATSLSPILLCVRARSGESKNRCNQMIKCHLFFLLQETSLIGYNWLFPHTRRYLLSPPTYILISMILLIKMSDAYNKNCI